MTRSRYNIYLEWDPEDEVWIACVPTLNWLSTYGATRDEALEQVREAVTGYLEAVAREGLEAPRQDTEAELISVEVPLP